MGLLYFAMSLLIWTCKSGSGRRGRLRAEVFARFDPVATIVGFAMVLFGVYTGDLGDIFAGAFLVLSGYPATWFFGSHKGVEG